jgi:LAS superfamily LD-carboxypeptidase LdcB
LYTYYILCAQGAKIDSPEQLQKFTWDDEDRQRKPISQEEIDELQALIASANKEIRNDSASETGAEDETN